MIMIFFGSCQTMVFFLCLRAQVLIHFTLYDTCAALSIDAKPYNVNGHVLT